MGYFLNFVYLYDNYDDVKYEHGIYDETCLVTYR